MKYLRLVCSLCCLLAPLMLRAQNPVQTVRGIILDTYTQRPVSGVGVKVLGMPDSSVVVSGEEGKFRIEGVPVGRQDIAFSHPDYEGFTRPGVMVTRAKEVVLEIWLKERVFSLEEVTLQPAEDKGRARNEMAAVSAISIEVEETRKYAGGLDDPTRLAANLPGVNGNGFISDNMISIRGNSPRGMMYRLQGAEVPNPNHFARIGSSGGTFTIFSIQLLDNSDFFTGAFPAEYGNATSGVFDINFRKGNNEKREYAIQAGVLGVDLAAEGPFKAGGESSYLVNYRFSSLLVANLLIDYLTLPEYQDLSFNLHFPTKKAGTFTVYGIGGISKRVKPAETDPANWIQDLDRFDNVLSSDMAAVGVSHRLLLGKKSLLQSSLVGSYSFLTDNKNYLEEDLEFRLRDRNEYQRQPISLATSLKHTFSPRHVNKTGLMLTTTHHDHIALDYDYVRERLDTLVNESGRDLRFQAYTQSLFRLSPKLSLSLGVHMLYYQLEDTKLSLEPRAGLNLEVVEGHVLGLVYGLHSQVEDFATYTTRLIKEDGSFSQPNLSLDLLRSHHVVLSYYGRFAPHLKLRAEVYYQHLYGVPTEPGGSFATINLEELNQLRTLDNSGTSRNVGLDLGLERYTHHGLYYMVNASMFDSRYAGGDGVERNTAFNSGYKVNLLAGKEFRVGKKKGKHKLMGFNGTLSALGGQRYTPIDLEASRAARETVYDESQAWSMQEQPLWVLDVTWTLRNTGHKVSHYWAIQIKNLLQSAVPEYREYDATLDEVVTLEGASVLPVMSYKIEF